MPTRAEVDSRDIDESVRMAEDLAGLTPGAGPESILATEERPLTAEEERRERAEDKLRLARLETMLRETLEVMKASGAQGVAGTVASELERKLQLSRIAGIVERGGFAKILIHPTANPNETWLIDLGINGDHIKVRRGVATKVPVRFLTCLELAEKLDYAPVVVDGRPLIQETRVMSYPYTLIEVTPN